MPFINPFANIFTSQAPAAVSAPQAPVSAVPSNVPAPVAPSPSGDANVQNATPTPANTPVQTPGTDANGLVPAGEQKIVSPLDEYQDFWHNDPKAKPATGFTPETLDPTKLQEVIAKTNMISAITPEIQARINAGGEDANVAMNEAINLVAQQTLMQSTNVANKMMSQQATKLMDYMTSQLPSMVKSQNLTNNLHDQNPLFKNPAVAPIIEATTAQLQTKFPTASAQELSAMAQNYVKAMAESLNPAPVAPNLLDKEVDWSGFETQ